MKKYLCVTVVSWLLFVVLPSFKPVRAFLSYPLVVSVDNARGDACYVLSGGAALWERLAAASDLYHMKRVPKIILTNNSQDSSQYNFPARISWTQTQWAVDYLVWRGVPKDRIKIIDSQEGFFGTLSEARTLANETDIKTLVLVTSAPHTRRSLLIFRRNLKIPVHPYAATPPINSAELYEPLWLEYLKLFVYAVFL